jgi:TrmH family RNA methyltransferase
VLENPRSPRVRAVAKLGKRSSRAETGLFLLEGPQAVREALAFRPELIVELFATAKGAEKHAEIWRDAGASGIERNLATEAVLAAMADTVTPQGILAVARQKPATLDEVLANSPRLLAVCHQVRDPGNLGTIIRAADASGADAVILTGRAVDPYNPKVVRSTTGSLFHLPIVVAGELADVAKQLKGAGLTVLAADVKGDDLIEVRNEGFLATPSAWVFGNEAHGLDESELELADRVLKLPIFGRAESLNLATAASICLYESAFAQRT